MTLVQKSKVPPCTIYIIMIRQRKRAPFCGGFKWCADTVSYFIALCKVHSAKAGFWVQGVENHTEKITQTNDLTQKQGGRICMKENRTFKKMFKNVWHMPSVTCLICYQYLIILVQLHDMGFTTKHPWCCHPKILSFNAETSAVALQLDTDTITHY